MTRAERRQALFEYVAHGSARRSWAARHGREMRAWQHVRKELNTVIRRSRLAAQPKHYKAKPVSWKSIPLRLKHKT